MTRALLGLLLVLACGGCATITPPPPNIADAPVVSWAPKGPAHAVIIAVHGFDDHMTAFSGLGHYAATQGVRVIAYDQPGFGLQPDRGYWPGTAALDEALAARIRQARVDYPGLPLFVLGESMGAAVAVTTLARPDAPQVDGVILSAPAVWGGDALNPLYRTLLTVMSQHRARPRAHRERPRHPGIGQHSDADDAWPGPALHQGDACCRDRRAGASDGRGAAGGPAISRRRPSC